MDLLPVYLEPEFAFEDVPPLILITVPMQRWTRKRPRPAFEDGKCAARIATRNLDRYVIAEHVDRLAIAALHDVGITVCISKNRHLISLLS
jgi:hypothetical protein